MSLWKFEIGGGEVHSGQRTRKMLSGNGCNEPYKDRYWCPKRKWFLREPCPFVNVRECNTFQRMCGSL